MECQAGSIAWQDTDQHAAKEVAALRQELGEPVRGALSGSELSMAALLGVLAAYQRCIPEAAADAHFDPARLLAKVIHQNVLCMFLAAAPSA